MSRVVAGDQSWLPPTIMTEVGSLRFFISFSIKGQLDWIIFAVSRG
jgi:hypothetical protein